MLDGMRDARKVSGNSLQARLGGPEQLRHRLETTFETCWATEDVVRPEGLGLSDGM